MIGDEKTGQTELLTGAGGPAAGLATEPYPRFSDAEMAARRQALEQMMAEHGADHLVLYGVNRTGSAIPWLTRWPVTQRALAILTPGERAVLFVGAYNHVPNAERMATETEVRWIGEDMARTAAEELAHRGGRNRRIGLVGRPDYRDYAVFQELTDKVVPLDRPYQRLRMRKSEEELVWTRHACELTDRGLNALQAVAAPGVREIELVDAIERGWGAGEGTTHIHYLASTSMADPQVSVPSQWPSRRHLQAGDAIFCELSSTFWGYTGQVLRTLAVAAEPAQLYRELYEVAQAAFDAGVSRLHDGATAAELVEAAGVIDAAGFTIRDGFLHGFIGGIDSPILPPSLNTPATTVGKVTDFTFQSGMTVVVQPNVVTKDERAGVQLGELVLVTADGAERLHHVEHGFLRVGG